MVTVEKLYNLRNYIEKYFSVKTSLTKKKEYKGGSDGHCAVVSLLLYTLYKPNVKLYSTKLERTSHWYNQITLENGQIVDVDLTGDQFGYEPVRIAKANTLYEDGHERFVSEINTETEKRFKRFLSKLNKKSIVRRKTNEF